MKITQHKTSELFPYINNAREHSESQVIQIASSIREFGFTNPLLIDDDGGIIAGHGRLMAAKKLEMDEVPCIVLSGLSEAKKKALILADNKLALNATWDEELLKLELESLAEMDVDIGLTGFSSDELDELLEEFNQEELPNNIDDVPEVETPVSELGDIWLLGKHRLMCGDSTDEEQVVRLLDGQKADMVFTDPPYDHNQKAIEDKESHSIVKKATNKLARKIDHLSSFNPEKMFKLLSSKKLSSLNYLFFCSKDLILKYLSFAKEQKMLSNVLVWKKLSAIPLNASYISDVEYIIVMKKNSLFNYGLKDCSYSKVFECSRELGEHPTIKPQELCLNYIKINSNEGQKILDLFGGSGSTLIACEQSNRQCYMMELDTGYMDVIINRWQNLTKQQAIHVQSGMTYEERQLQLGGD